MGVPTRGVDLSLDSFNLSAAEQDGHWVGSVEAPKGMSNASIGGKVLLSALAKDNSTFSSEDHSLLKEIFHSSLCDRKGEEDCFLLPPTNNVDTLRALVQAEADLREQRSKHFFSAEFSSKDAGPLFPSSWASTVELAGAEAKEAPLHPRPELQAQPELLEELLDGAVPAFDRRAEDGVRFLIYRLGSLEIRATEAAGETRVIGAVFSVRAKTAPPTARGVSLPDAEKIVKVTEYVEAAAHGKMQCHYFVVLHTEQGHRVLMERLANGMASWSENLAALDDRVALARVMDSADTRGLGVTVATMRLHHAAEAKDAGRANAASSAKRYAHSACSRAAGRAFVPVRPPASRSM